MPIEQAEVRGCVAVRARLSPAPKSSDGDPNGQFYRNNWMKSTKTFQKEIPKLDKKNGNGLMHNANSNFSGEGRDAVMLPEGGGQSIYRSQEKEGNHLRSDVESYNASLF